MTENLAKLSVLFNWINSKPHKLKNYQNIKKCCCKFVKGYSNNIFAKFQLIWKFFQYKKLLFGKVVIAQIFCPNFCQFSIFFRNILESDRSHQDTLLVQILGDLDHFWVIYGHFSLIFWSIFNKKITAKMLRRPSRRAK